jgi:PAS domain S-box-containing protein
MRFGIAAKLGLLASVLVLLIALVTGFLFYCNASVILVEHELIDLSDETALRGRELLLEIHQLREDVLALAGRPPVQGLLRAGTALPKGTDPVTGLTEDDWRQRLEKDFQQLLASERAANYRCARYLALDDGRELVRVRREGDGVRALRGLELQPQKQKPYFQDLKNRVAENRPEAQPVYLAEVTLDQEGADGAKRRPAVLRAAVPVSAATSPKAEAPFGLIVLELDFDRLTDRLRQSPRHLGFLTNSQGDYLVHPDRGKEFGFEAGRRFRIQEEERFRDQLAASYPKGGDGLQLAAAGEGHGKGLGGGIEANSKNQGGFLLKHSKPSRRGFWERLTNSSQVDPYFVELPDLAFHLRPGKLDPGLDPAAASQLRQAVAGLAEKYPAVKATRLTEASKGLLLSSRDRGPLDELARQISSRCPGQIHWDAPLECNEFALHFVQLPLDPLRPQERFLGLGLAVSYEEINADVAAAHGTIILVTLGLSAAAAGLALLFYMLLTRPLMQITQATEQFARGEPEVALPVKRRDEIGALARAFRDMTAQVRRHGEELQEGEARMRAILTTAVDAIITVDEEWKIETFNQAAERFFGYKADEVKGRYFRLLVHDPYQVDPGDSLTPPPGTGGTLLRSAAEVTREVIGRRKDGTTFPMEVSVSEVLLENRRIFTAILRDITERKQAVQQIQQLNAELERRVRERTAELEDANARLEVTLDQARAATRARDTFLANMSHELRTPLNAILGFSEMLQDDAAEAGQAEFVPDLKKIHAAGSHLLALVNDILDLAKIEAEQLRLDLTVFELPPLLEELRGLMDPLIKKKKNTLAVHWDPDLGAMQADRTRVRQVLFNLLSNASKFTEQGVVTLRVGRAAGDGVDRVVFSVTDTGIGMTPEQVKSLFKPWFQADPSSTRRQGGAGLGLAISRSLCQIMGGDIEVHSEPGKGSTFVVRLPVRVSLPETKPVLMRREPAGNGLRTAARTEEPATVLVIDDDSAVCELMERFLRKEGFRVRTASSGVAGLRLAQELRPAAITLDAVMPGIDGWSVLSALKSDPATADIPIIMVTIVDDKTRGYALGAAEYITKPINWTRLAGILRHYQGQAPAGHVLVVEDEEVTRGMVCRMLTKEGWAVAEAQNGRVALQSVAERLPAVILLDLMMPEMDGFQFVEELRKHEAWRGIPVVVVTAVDLTDADRHRLNGYVEQILRKGAHTREDLLHEIRDRVSECVHRRRAETKVG